MEPVRRERLTRFLLEPDSVDEAEVELARSQARSATLEAKDEQVRRTSYPSYPPAIRNLLPVTLPTSCRALTAPLDGRARR